MYEEARNDATIDPTVPDGRILKAPEGTIVYVDGRVWKEPGLTPDRPHIVFIASRADRHIIDRFVVDGYSCLLSWLAVRRCLFVACC